MTQGSLMSSTPEYFKLNWEEATYALIKWSLRS